MNAYNSLVIIAMIPILDYGFFPLLAKCGIKDTPLRRMGAGLFFSSLAVGIAGIMEYVRRGSDHLVTPCLDAEIEAGWCNPEKFSYQFIDEKTNGLDYFYKTIEDDPEQVGFIMPVPPGSTEAVPLTYVNSRCVEYDKESGVDFIDFSPIKNVSIWLYLFPLGTVGISEILFAAVCTDFFYSQVAPEIRAIMQAFNMLTVSMGTILGGVIDVAFSKVIEADLDHGHLEYDYFANCALGLLTLGVFIYKSRNFEYMVEEATTTTQNSSEESNSSEYSDDISSSSNLSEDDIKKSSSSADEVNPENIEVVQ